MGATLDTFWLALPPIMKLLTGLFLGGTLHFMRNRGVPIAEGLTSAFMSMIAGLVFSFVYCAWKEISVGDAWYTGAIITFLANYLLGGLETIGKQVQDSPIKTVVSSALEAYETVANYFKKPKI